MYDIIHSVISSGGYKRSDIQHKIIKRYVLGDLTDAEAKQLLSLADPWHLQKQKVRSCWRSCRFCLPEWGTGQETPDIPVWEPRDGISSQYQYGALIIHPRLVCQSVFNGQNMWEPGTLGEQFRKEVTAE